MLKRKLTLLTAILLLIASSAFAQFQTGTVNGVITDGTGAALPGVTVTLTGVNAPQSTITGARGDYRFVNLPPGTYVVSAELEGAGRATRGNIEVNVGKSTVTNLQLQTSVAETITVTADTPLLDVRNAGTGATVTQIELEKIPTARDPWVIIQQAPGVQIDRINVGGNESGQQSNYLAKGAGADQGTWNVDGVNITDMSALGSSPTYYDFDAFQEMQVVTGGSDPRIQTPGVQLNMVVKRGTNDWKGSGRFFGTNNSLQSGATVPTEAQSYLERTNEIDRIQDLGAELGGPIVKDRLWIWGSYGKNQIDLLASAAPGVGPSHDKTTLKNYNGKMNASITSNNNATLLYTFGDKVKIGRNVGPTRPPETSWDQSGPAKLYKFEDTHVFSPNFYATILASKVDAGFGLHPEGGLDVDAFRDSSRVWHRTYADVITDRPQKQYRADGGSYFTTGTLSHELKYGFGYRDTPVTSATTWPGSGNFAQMRSQASCDGFGVAFPCGYAFLQNPVANRDYETKYNDLYVGDTLLMGNVTLQVGARYDLQKGRNNPSVAPANSQFPALLPAINYQGDSRDLEWKSISPRVGLTYSLGSTKRTLLRAGYNRYVDQLGAGPLTLANPFYGNPGFLYLFEDRNGDNTIQPSEVRFDLGYLASFYLDPANPGGAVVPARIDYNMNPPQTDEFIIGAEQEIASNFSIGANYSYRRLKDFVWFSFEKNQNAGDFYTSNDYQLNGDVLRGTLPDGSSYSVPLYDLKGGVPVPLYKVVRNRPDFYETFNGIELLATKRMANNWMMRANLSLNDWKQHSGPNSVYDPNNLLSRGDAPEYFFPSGCSNCSGTAGYPVGAVSGSKGEVVINSRWSYNLTGVYQFPWQISVGAALSGREGYPIPYNASLATDNEGVTKKVLLTKFGSARYDNIQNIDLRLAKDFKFNAVGITVSADAFNITNQRTVLQRQSTLLNGVDDPNDAAGQILELQSPRIIRFGARVSF